MSNDRSTAVQHGCKPVDVLPWFAWAPRDFASDPEVLATIRAHKDVGELALRRAFDVAWIEGGLPGDVTACTRILGVSAVVARDILDHHFPLETLGKRWNGRQWQDFQEAVAKVENARKAGQASANARRAKRNGGSTAAQQPLNPSHTHTPSTAELRSACSASSASGSAEPPVMSFPITGQRDGGEWGLASGKLAEWQESFPHLDVERELIAARQWLRDNPGKRKTARGMTRFLGRWLSNAQDRGGSRSVALADPSKPVLSKRTADGMAAAERVLARRQQSRGE